MRPLIRRLIRRFLHVLAHSLIDWEIMPLRQLEPLQALPFSQFSTILSPDNKMIYRIILSLRRVFRFYNFRPDCLFRHLILIGSPGLNRFNTRPSCSSHAFRDIAVQQVSDF